MLNRAYLILGCGILICYGLAGYYGWELGTAKREVVPAHMRGTSGWARSSGWFMHSGYRGGK
jgi:hypothetical protein